MISKHFSLNNLLLVLGFILLVAIADNINFSSVLGASNQFFTLFQLFGPTIGAFLGPAIGAGVILTAELFSFVFNGKDFTLLNMLRLAPMLFATAYFALYVKKSKFSALVPLACMALFVLHPIGAQAWQYSLFWLVPVLALALPQNLLLRSYGATFSAHAVGGIIWLYTIPSTPAFWLALIPIVIFERTVFAVGISASYYCVTTVASRIDMLSKSGMFNLEEKYSLLPSRQVRARKN